MGDGKTLGSFEKDVPASRVVGGLGLVSHPGWQAEPATSGLFWFQNWAVDGSKIVSHDQRTLGPIVGTQYTLSRDVLKMTAQLMPLGESQPQSVELQVRKGARWVGVATSDVIVPGWTAPFRVADWSSRQDVDFRIVYRDEHGAQSTWSGTIRKDPVDSPSITVAGFTGNHNVAKYAGVARPTGKPPQPCDWLSDVYFPHADLTSQVVKHDPHVLFFSGDQIYEGSSPSFPDFKNLSLDYMYKWYLWCWAYRDLTRDIPSICIPDDHDVYQGNVWGQGGRKSPGRDNHGGYVHPAPWVNMVHRTQSSHLPDPFDPTPIKQDISVYYTDMNYGRISFAVVADRMFKNGCNGQGLPPSGSGRPTTLMIRILTHSSLIFRE